MEICKSVNQTANFKDGERRLGGQGLQIKWLIWNLTVLLGKTGLDTSQDHPLSWLLWEGSLTSKDQC